MSVILFEIPNWTTNYFFLRELLEMSEKREKLGAMLERDRARYQREDEDIEAQMKAKGINVDVGVTSTSTSSAAADILKIA